MMHNIKGVKINMFCSHPDMEGNSTASIGCNADCQNCKYCKAEMAIADCMELLEQFAGKENN